MAKLKCFVACAFNRADVDDVYDNVLLPTLTELDIEAIRVDRYNHNTHIDRKIIELIRKCDFGICDLSYTRPSVYYESGFIEGLGKEVIYTTRPDHFTHHPEKDPEGNRKIHFDLSTKNIIAWGAKAKFKQTLKQRIRLVTAPIISNQNEKSQAKVAENAFRSLSVENRLHLIQVLSKNFITNQKVKYAQMNGMGIALRKKGKEGILTVTTANLTKKILSDFHFTWQLRFSGSSIRDFIILVNVLNTIRASTVEQVLMSYENSGDKEYYTSNGIGSVRYIFIDGIRSKEEYEARLFLQLL